MQEAVIVAVGRSAIGKAPKGIFKLTRPEYLISEVIKGVLAKVPNVDPNEIDDVILGCAFPEAEQGSNVARIVTIRAGLPVDVPGQTINRFCASGLQSIAAAANSIMAGQNNIVLAGGIESMSTVPQGGNCLFPNPYIVSNAPAVNFSMGITAENVATKYGITREMQDELAVRSNLRAAAAQETGKFEEIIPIEANAVKFDANGFPVMTKVVVKKDEGVRPTTTMASLAKLRPVFKVGGTVTAGNCSQTSDGAAAVLLMSRQKADELGLKPLLVFRSFAAAGVDPAYMGLGPIPAIPKALKIAGLQKDDIDLFELNEAFASQALACVKELELDMEKINVNGGAIALGHPLGCTGSFLTAKLANEMARRQSRYGVISMCIGGGMGAAAVFERC